MIRSLPTLVALIALAPLAFPAAAADAEGISARLCGGVGLAPVSIPFDRDAPPPGERDCCNKACHAPGERKRAKAACCE